MTTIFSTPTTITVSSSTDKLADWAARSAGAYFAENFSTYSTAADWYNRFHQGYCTGTFTPKNPGMGSTWTNAWEIVTTPGHVLSGKALRMWHGKNNYGAAGAIDNQWAALPCNGDPNNIQGAYKTHLFFQACIWVDSFIDYYWKLGDGSLGGTKFFIIDQYNWTASQGEVVVTNQYNMGFVTGYNDVPASRDWARVQGTPSNNSNYAIQPAIDNGTALGSTDASYFRRYGPCYYGMYPGGLNQASALHLQGVPNADAAAGGVAWNRGGITVVECELDLTNDRLRVWAAPYGNPPKKLYDSGNGGAQFGSRVGTYGTGWSGVTLSNLIYTATGAQNPNYPTDAYTDYVELIFSGSPINFPGGYKLP